MADFEDMRAYFTFTATSSEAFVGVDTWNPRMVPNDCETGNTKFQLKVTVGDENGKTAGQKTGTAYGGFVSK